MHIYIYYGKVMCNRYVQVDEVNTAMYAKMPFYRFYIGQKTIGRAIDLFVFANALLNPYHYWKKTSKI
jgi:hypothetical protein